MERHAPVVRRLPERYREAVTELAHWAYRAAKRAAFGLLPDRVRRHPAAGPGYGLAVWLGFEAGIAPLLGVHHVHERSVAWRGVVALDHVLYGVVAGRLAPERPAPGSRPGAPRGGQASLRLSRNAARASSATVHRAKTP